MINKLNYTLGNMLKLASENELIKDCQKGKRKAQKKLYERYAPTMLGLCIRYMKDQYEAEDVLSEAFIKIFANIKQFKFEGSFEGWIRRIMVNECLSQLRKKRRLYAQVDIEELNREPNYEELGDELHAEDLLMLINALPDGYRTIFNLYAIEGYSHKEIAEQLNITVGTSKSQLSRARSLLQKSLLQQENLTQTIKHG